MGLFSFASRLVEIQVSNAGWGCPTCPSPWCHWSTGIHANQLPRRFLARGLSRRGGGHQDAIEDWCLALWAREPGDTQWDRNLPECLLRFFEGPDVGTADLRALCGSSRGQHGLGHLVCSSFVLSFYS
ncbi:hypothetical protein Celaphus_00007511 [Cervus elaphus hippelaphus]|uniref:Uncharacterized protein n=1 Tax=Cervus elaphus hippelaphus TaxID=46360 RepID=A0A212CBV2_CEREH|nr:hypothetical protein Celaphus_00007511 [Cervus elaphus hippelaphus]